MGERRLKLRPDRLLAGHAEPIFDGLPEAILENFRHPTSENALLWNLIYPLAQPSIPLANLLRLRPLWGTHMDQPIEDELSPFYWGYGLSGERLPGLDAALDELDGPGPRTEVDLFLLGEHNLVLAEAKCRSGLGRCWRYSHARCPEIHGSVSEDASCRYWERRQSRFTTQLDFGEPATAFSDSPACHRHYQLGRTLMLGVALAGMLERRFHLWAFVPRSRWKRLEGDWLDFCQRVRDGGLWRRMRVFAWEDLQGMSRSGSEGAGRACHSLGLV